ncbi:MAG TPA: DUF1622 domain-containing protein [Pyrinomonadaceae bacterium]|nr:DUF1622 domain-containing protein [Pyrinomonadaceae bacterium]
MEELFKDIAARVALGVELLAAAIIAFGTVHALVLLIITRATEGDPFRRPRLVFLRFGGWLMLGLEFELAADIVRSAISPGWKEIGQLAAIAAIRTFLNYFLGRDVKEFGEPLMTEARQPE